MVLLALITGAFKPFSPFMLFLIAPIVLAFFIALYTHRYLGAIAIAVYLIIGSLLIMSSPLLDPFSAYTTQDAVSSILLILGLLLIISHLRPVWGHGKERGITAIFTILLLSAFIASLILIPTVDVSPHAAELYVLYNIILIATLIPAFTIIRILFTHVSQNHKNLTLIDLLVDFNLAMLTVGMFSAPVIYIDLAGMCSCSGCVSTIAPGLTAFMVSLTVPSAVMILGHMYGVRGQ